MTDSNTPTSRREQGLKVLSHIHGGTGEAVVASLAEIAPDFADYLLEFPFGDLYSRPGLSLRDRQIATIASLATQGHAQPQLKVHIKAGLNVGLTAAEITEVIMHMAIYAGFPATLNALFTAKEAFSERGIEMPSVPKSK